MGGFQLFNQRFLRRNFHTIAVNRHHLLAAALDPNDAMVLYANHASWWDPLLALFMAPRVFPGFRLYAPIDADAFEKYRMFGHMGFFPVRQQHRAGAVQFLKTSRRILQSPGASLWITPEGRFADVRDHRAALMPGLAHLAYQLSVDANTNPQPCRVWFVPAALEYVFWEERTPEVLIWLGRPVRIPVSGDPASRDPVSENSADEFVGSSDGPTGFELDKSGWLQLLTDRLREAQNELADASISRDTSPFDVLLSNRGGTFFLYDWWRKLRARVTGKTIDVSHSDKWHS